jgi:hypothetical protein
MGEMRSAYRISIGKPEGRRQFGDLGVHDIIISKLILKNRVLACGLDSSGTG